MVSVKWNGSHSMTNSFWNYYYHHHQRRSNSNNSTNTTTGSSVTHGVPVPSSGLLPSQTPPQSHRQRRVLVTILLGTFVFITMFIPILRFVRYDDSHLLQSMLLLDTPVSSSTGTGRSTSSSSSTVTLLDVALGNAPLSDYYHVQSSSTSSSSSLQAALTVTKPNELDHSDPIPPANKQTFLRQNTPDNSDATAGSVKDATTTHDQAHTDEEDNSSPEAHEGEGVQEDAEEEHQIAKIEEDTVDEPDGETGATDKEEEEEHVIQPTRRIIPPFSWDDQLRNAHNYIQSFANVGRTIYPPRKTQHQYDPLLFFHIPKTAGTAIEYAAGMNPDRPLAWGSCRFNHTPKRDICHYPKHSQPCTYRCMLYCIVPFEFHVPEYT